MIKLLLGLSLVAGAEAAANACYCPLPEEPEASRPLAREAVKNAVAIVEVDVLSGFGSGAGGETVRLRRTLFGEAPETFQIKRRPNRFTSCDLMLAKGQRYVLILSNPVGDPVSGQRYDIQLSCSDYLTRDPRHLEVTLQEARRRLADVKGPSLVDVPQCP